MSRLASKRYRLLRCMGPLLARRVARGSARDSDAIGRTADMPRAPLGPTNPSRLTRSRHRAEAFQIEAQAGPGSGIPPAKMSQRVSLSDVRDSCPLYVAMSRAR